MYNHIEHRLQEKEIAGNDFDFHSRSVSGSISKASGEVDLALSHLYREQISRDFNTHKILRRFYESYPSFWRYLCPNIARNTIRQIQIAQQHRLRIIPEITYILPVYQCDKTKIQESINSIRDQIGVETKCIIVIDGTGPADMDTIKHAINSSGSAKIFSILDKKENKGVACARNTGMRHINTEYFSWLDANDVIHPLRSLHSILLLLNHHCKRVNTAYARVSLKNKKIITRNGKFSHCGHTSFVSKTSLIRDYGYLSNLKYHEDTEYQQRLEFFNVPIVNSHIATHFLDLEQSSQHLHLSGDSWTQYEPISDHSYLEGTYEGRPTPERIHWNKQFEKKYNSIRVQMSTDHFPCIE